MSRWHRVTQYPSFLKEFQIADWRWPALRPAVAWLAALLSLHATVLSTHASGPTAARFPNPPSAYLTVADSPQLRPEVFTVECWVRPIGPGEGNTMDAPGAVYFAKTSPFGAIFASSIGMQWSPVTKRINAVLAFGAPTSSGVTVTSTSLVLEGTWVHTAMTFNGAVVRLYINGVLEASVNYPFESRDWGNWPFYIGAGNACCGYSRRFDGEMDDLRFWDYPRTQPQIAAEMHQEVSGPQPGLLAAWNFNCGDYRDVSNNGHNATATGPVSFVPQNPSLIAAPYAIAAAGDDQSVPEGTPVALDGSASSAACGAPTYAWTQIAGPVVTLAGADTAAPSFHAPYVTAGGVELVFQLIVSDGPNTSAPDTVSIQVNDVTPVPMVGDANCDGAVNNFDIDAFVSIILFGTGTAPPEAWTHGESCWAARHVTGDLDQSGAANNFDIDAFVACVVAPPPAGAACP